MPNLTQIFKNLGANPNQAARLAQGEYLDTENDEIEEFYWDLVDLGYFDHEPAVNQGTYILHVTTLINTDFPLKYSETSI